MALVANRPIVIALTAFPPIMICSGMAGLLLGFASAASPFRYWPPAFSNGGIPVLRPFINKDKEEMVKVMSGKLEILFLSKKQVNALAADNMSEVMHDMERVLSLLDEGKAISPNKASAILGRDRRGRK
ncbi:MAG: hypothetical protein RQM89_10305 [Acetomicrobium sp.]